MSSSAITGPILSDTRRAPAGTAAAPSFAFNDSTGTGVYLVSAGVLGLSTAGVQRVVVDASGNVGIGTASPLAKLSIGSGSLADTQVPVQINAATGTEAYYGINKNGGYGALYGYSTSGSLAVIKTVNSEPIAFYTGNINERMRIDASGNLLVGTTSSLSRLTVSANVSGTGARVASIFSNTTGDLSNAGLVISKFDNNSTTSQVYMHFVYANNSLGSGQINGNGANQAAFGSYSDQRLKENIVSLPPQLNNILSLRPVEFDYIESEGGGHQIGFIAQELEEIYPDAVGERPDGMKIISGWDKTTARLVKAIQEQQEIIGKLEARLAALEGK